MTCVKTQEFLAKAGVTAKAQEDAKKKTRGADGARELLKEADEIYIAKGKNLVHFTMKDAKPEEVVPLMLGPTGNLRAPTIRKGRTIMVGFNKEAYEKLFI
jgi:arsenate reductase-like glutaredoxin family protein